jgi:hypothetical protein
MGEDQRDTAQIKLPRLYERDIDVLLQEELLFSEAVCAVFSCALGFRSPLRVSQCSLSYVDKTGETDLLAHYDVDDVSGILLIENKIDAAFQPKQAERYKARATAMALTKPTYCVLIAPTKYALTKVDSLHFDACVSYEDVARAICSEETERANHRASLIMQAVQQAKSPYFAIPEPEVTTMWERIYGIARTEFPLLRMKEPTSKGKDSWWLCFKGNLPSLVTIDWKVKNGFVDLSFWNGAQHKPTSSTQLPLGATFIATGTTILIRVSVEKPPQAWVNLTVDQIRIALAVAYKLLEYYNRYAESFPRPAQT